mmetsp:Transcript_15161/g.26454  ORF Transcript_15161/g.26454 Transcript_15161/m.26454 type:complete len:202 (-) Transcript_15161:573-1178(-)
MSSLTENSGICSTIQVVVYMFTGFDVCLLVSCSLQDHRSLLDGRILSVLTKDSVEPSAVQIGLDVVLDKLDLFRLDNLASVLDSLLGFGLADLLRPVLDFDFLLLDELFVLLLFLGPLFLTLLADHGKLLFRELLFRFWCFGYCGCGSKHVIHTSRTGSLVRRRLLLPHPRRFALRRVGKRHGGLRRFGSCATARIGGRHS